MNFNLDLNRVKLYIKDNQKQVRMAALILIVGLSILFFWIKGDSGTIKVEENTQEDIETSEEVGIKGEEGEGTTASPEDIYVDISGEVKDPGVYKVTTETRLFEVIDMAGGLTGKADTNSLNRAEKVTDGQKVIVRAIGETSDQGYDPYDQNYDGEEDVSGGKVNINIADMEALQILPGIGPQRAKSIIDYREQNGYYSTIEEIMNVSGIGERTFDSIKDMIDV